MVNFRDPSVVAQDSWTQVKLWHTVYGLYLWELFITLDYEWRVIRGHSPYRWTIWIYSLARVAGLMGAILSLVGMDVTTPINCQLWITSELIFSYLSLATASLLVVLRIIAIWNKKKVIVMMSFSVWGINVVFLIQGIARLRAVWVPEELTCVVVNTASNTLTIISMAIADMALLFIMLFGLLRLRYHGGGTFGLTHLLWKQGVILILLAAAAEVPPAVFVILNLNAPFNIMFQVPAVVTMTIAATRMHRSLVDFTSGSSDVAHENLKESDLMFSMTKQARVMRNPLNRAEMAVRTDFEQHPIPQMSDDVSSIKIDVKVHQQLNGLDLDDDVECGA